MNMAKLILDGREYEFPVVVGSEGEKGIDISALRAGTGAITLDPGYGNTGSCVSEITFIDGEQGILRYRGYPIEQLAEQADFVEVGLSADLRQAPQPPRSSTASSSSSPTTACSTRT